MSFETYPIPETSSNLDELNARVQSQTDRIVPIISKLYGELDNRLLAQDSANGRIQGKLIRALNGRVKKQGNGLSAISNALINNLNNRIAEQGQQIAVQSAVLSHFEPVSPPVGHLPQHTSGPTQSPSIPVGMGGRAPALTTFPSLPPGVSAPSFTLAPNEVLPQPPASAAVGQVVTTAVLVNCDDRTLAVYDLSDFNVQRMVSRGKFVPIRYGVEESLRANFLGNSDAAAFMRQYQPRWVNIACQSRLDNGKSWPVDGDFINILYTDPNFVSTSLDMGTQVGPWPFPQ